MLTLETERRRVGPWRLVGFLPVLAFAATFGVFLVDKNREARTVLGSGRGLATVALIIGGYVVASAIVRRTASRPWVAPVAMTAVVLALAAWVVRPYYVDTTADRRLVSDPVTVPAGDRAPPAGGPAPPVAGPPAGPVVVASGPLGGLGHDARGTVSLIRTPEAGLVVRLSDFDIEGVPDPRLFLIAGKDVERVGGTELGPLRGNRGKVLDIAVPPGVEAAPGWTFLVWCRAFSVPVANATLG